MYTNIHVVLYILYSCKEAINLTCNKKCHIEQNSNNINIAVGRDNY